MMRAILALTRAVEKLTDRLDSLHEEYMPREVAEGRFGELDRRIAGIVVEQVDLGADLTRHHKDHADSSNANWSRWVVPIVTAIVVATFTAFLFLVLHPVK